MSGECRTSCQTHLMQNMIQSKEDDIITDGPRPYKYGGSCGEVIPERTEFMCDAFVFVPPAGQGPVLLGKNSDREPDEAQVMVRSPRALARGPRVQLTYIEIPQVETTHEILISRPFHMWGAEMGVNEHGVAIGNEAVFTRAQSSNASQTGSTAGSTAGSSGKKENSGLSGMDLVRLGLERASSADEAVEVMTALLEKYGQNACGGYRDRQMFYDNSFLVADPTGAWVLETAGQEWAARRITGFYAISNGLTLGVERDKSSPTLEATAQRNGWAKAGEPVDFARAYATRGHHLLSQCHTRQAQVQKAGPGPLDLQKAFSALRGHGASPFGGQGAFHPARGHMGSVCMHANGGLSPYQTTGSMVAQLRPDGQSQVWATGTSAPCLSAYKPYFLGGDPALETPQVIPGARADQSLWWQFERLHRQVMPIYSQVAPKVRAAFDALEKQWLTQLDALAGQRVGAAHRQLSIDAQEAFLATTAALYLELLKGPRPARGLHPLYHYYWDRLNGRNGVLVNRVDGMAY